MDARCKSSHLDERARLLAHHYCSCALYLAYSARNVCFEATLIVSARVLT